MTWASLIVDLKGGRDTEALSDAASTQESPTDLVFVSSYAEAKNILDTGKVLTMTAFADQATVDLEDLLKVYQTNVGVLTKFVCIVCDDPSPWFIAGMFEYGLDQFIARDKWLVNTQIVASRALALLADDTTTESRIFHLTRSIRAADQNAIKAYENAIGDLDRCDYRLAFAKGKACEATGEYRGAVEAYRHAAQMNPMFRPALSSLGETLLIICEVDEAMAGFKKLERSYPYNIDRKANMAVAHMEKGDFTTANEWVAAAEAISPKAPRVLEARAQFLLCTGQEDEAFKLMDNMSEVGPVFAAKMNEIGIRLSKDGNGKRALAIYQKAHKIVRPELRYKISLNAALACRRLEAWQLALKYVDRCEREYGSVSPKTAKFRSLIAKNLSESADDQ